MQHLKLERQEFQLRQQIQQLCASNQDLTKAQELLLISKSTVNHIKISQALSRYIQVSLTTS